MQKTTSKLTLLQAFVHIISAARQYIFAILCAILGLLLARIAEGGIYKFLIPQTLDEGFIARDMSFLHTMPLLVVGIFIFLASGEFLSKYFMGYVGRSVVRDYRAKMLQHLLVIPATYYKLHSTGELLSKINYDTEQIATAVSDAIKELINSIIAIIILFAVMLTISVEITFSILLVAPLVAGIMRFAGKKMRRYSSRVQTSMGKLTKISSEIINGFAIIRSYQGQAQARDTILLAVNDNRNQELKTFMVTAASAASMQLVGGTVLVTFLFVVIANYTALTPGEIFGLIGAMFALIRPLKQLTEVNNVLQRGVAAIESIDKLLTVPAEQDSGVAALPRCQDKGRQISLANINFYYEPSHQILQNISFIAQPGETVAIVGKSGSGKTTLVSLINLLFAPTSGKISIDGVDITSLPLECLRSQISIVNQDIFLFNETVAYNIAFGCNSSRTPAEIYAAAKAANAYEFIQKLPQGFDTVVGENGSNLSGGQKQRIAIARAILKQAPILILDEATSALDTESEKVIQKHLQLLQNNCTTIVIAHRLSTIENADKILVLDEGRVVESGTHQQLIQHQGLYAKMLQQQVIAEFVTND